MKSKLLEEIRSADVYSTIEKDEILRSITRSVGYKVFLGWVIVQFLIGASMYAFTSEKTSGLLLAGFSFLASLTWMTALLATGVIRAAKETSMNSRRSKQVALLMAIAQGVYFSTFISIVNVLWISPEFSTPVNILSGVTAGVLYGGSYWFIHGHIKKRM